MAVDGEIGPAGGVIQGFARCTTHRGEVSAVASIGRDRAHRAAGEVIEAAGDIVQGIGAGGNLAVGGVGGLGVQVAKLVVVGPGGGSCGTVCRTTFCPGVGEAAKFIVSVGGRQHGDPLADLVLLPLGGGEDVAVGVDEVDRLGDQYPVPVFLAGFDDQVPIDAPTESPASGFFGAPSVSNNESPDLPASAAGSSSGGAASGPNAIALRPLGITAIQM